MQSVQVKTIYGTFHSHRNDLITFQLKKFSAHCRNELAMLLSLLKKGDHVIDIGGHIGTFSIPFGITVGEQGSVSTFEANPDNYELLARNIAENNLSHTITATHAVVSAEGGYFDMHLPVTSDSNANTNSGLFYFTHTDKKTELPAIHIDDWFAGQPNKLIALIKIDVEGAEVSVLKSCMGIIKEQQPMLYIEINQRAMARFDNSPDDIYSMLTNIGYNFYRNIGQRNSTNDEFKIVHMLAGENKPKLYDILAIHKDDRRSLNL